MGPKFNSVWLPIRFQSKKKGKEDGGTAKTERRPERRRRTWRRSRSRSRRSRKRRKDNKGARLVVRRC